MRANEPNAHLIDGRQNFKIDVWPFSFVLGLNWSPRQKMRLTSYQVKITFGNSICLYLLIDKGDVVIQTLCRSQKVEALRLLNLKIYSRYLTHSVDTAHFYYIYLLGLECFGCHARIKVNLSTYTWFSGIQKKVDFIRRYEPISMSHCFSPLRSNYFTKDFPFIFD